MNDEFNKYDVYATSGSIYCYADTNVLRNRFGICDLEELNWVDNPEYTYLNV